MKTLTIVVSCYNCSKTIQATLESIPATGKDDFDVMIIDDGSTEDIYPIIKPFCDKYPRTMKYVRKENGGHGSCINYSIDHAKSRYVAFLDSDDTYNPVDFNIALNFLAKTHKNTDLVLMNYNMVFVDKDQRKVQHHIVSKTWKRIEYKTFKQMPLNGFITIHSSIYSLELLKKIHKLPEHVSYEDNILYYEVLLRAKKIAYLNKLIYLYNYFIYGAGQQSISIDRLVRKLDQQITVYKYALTLPINHFPKSRDIVVKKSFLAMMGFILVSLSYDESKTKLERGKMANAVFALYKDFLGRNKGRNIKPIVYSMFANTTYGGTNWIKLLSKLVRINFLRAVLYQPKDEKEKIKKEVKNKKVAKKKAKPKKNKNKKSKT